MKRAGRKFDMYVIGAQDVERLRAWKTQREVRFSYEDSRRLRRVRKRNTFLFDALADLTGRPYQVSSGVLEDVLYEAIMVDFSPWGNVRCLQPEDVNSPCVLPAAELEKTLYEQGFYVTRADGVEVHFVPFVASASMSREEEYLFVNADRLDALLRMASLDMVAAADGDPVLDGKPLQAEEPSPFGGLEPDAKVASVPKLAAYLGLALSDGVSLRELLAGQGAGEDKGEWLLGLNEGNTVCVADWADAPMQLDAFPCCWVNEEAPRSAGTLASRNVSGSQTELQRRLQALFAALYQPERAVFDSLMAEADVTALWQDAIARFFRQRVEVDQPEERIPHLLSSPQGTSVYVAAVLYAACLQAEEGDFLLPWDKAGLTDEQVLTEAELQGLVARLGKEERLRNHLWNMLHEQDPAMNHVLAAVTDGQGLHLRLRRAPCTMFRAVLRHVRWRERQNHGNFYDGCGFMDDDLFDRLETLLRGGPRPADQEPLNAVQIRLPWCKGLLVRFTATEFFRSWAQGRGCRVPGLTICDMFGQRRPLFDQQGKPLVKAFFTASMFKGGGWFRRLKDCSAPGTHGDRWAEYWRRLRAHRVSMLIAGKSTQPGRTSRLNYQFLSTLGLEEAELHKLVERRLRRLGEALQPEGPGSGPDVRAMAELLLGLAAPEEEAEIPDFPALPEEEDETGTPPEAAEPEPQQDEPEDQEAEEEDYLTLLARALTAHPAAMGDTALIMDRFDRLVRSEVQQMMRGRLTVSGDVRYLLPDLLQMVRYMARRFIHLPDGTLLSDVQGYGLQDGDKPARPAASPINDCGGDHLYGCYYAPGDNVPWQYASDRTGASGRLMDVAILRNPHYAQGEAPVLSPLSTGQRREYDLWFSGLTGCVMVSSAVMYTINGADCDGDRVNVCAEPDVITAIRRRARRENGLMSAVVSSREAILRWLSEEEARCGNRNVMKYLRLLQAELPSILPDAGDRRYAIRNSYPPLIYAGSAAKGMVFSPADLGRTHLRDKLWDAFGVSRMQRIGRMSLRVLERTPDAYGDIPERAEVGMTPRELLACFLARYLVVSGALNTAMEIDMAKTGARREEHPLMSIPVELRKALGMQRSSGFYRWRRAWQDAQQRLNGYGFAGALQALMRDYAMAWTPPAAGVMGLDVLPMIVYRLFSPDEAAALQHAAQWPAPAPREKPARRVIRETMLGDGGKPVRGVLRTPTEAELAALRIPCENGQSLQQTLQELLRQYDRARRLHNQALRAGEGLDKAYVAVLRWLLTNGFGLDDALAGLDMLREMIRRWCAHLPAGAKRLCDVFGKLQRLTQAQSAAVRWGWTADAAERGRQLDQMLEKAHDVKKLQATELGFTGEERALLCCSRRSIVLVRRLAEYGWREALLQEWTTLPAVPAPDELEASMRRAIAAVAPACVDGVLRAACYVLRDRHYTDASGRSCALMSDFLLTYLLRTQLDDAIADPAMKGGEPG